MTYTYADMKRDSKHARAQLKAYRSRRTIWSAIDSEALKQGVIILGEFLLISAVFATFFVYVIAFN